MSYFEQHWNENFSTEIPITKITEAKRFLQPFFNYQKYHQERLFVLDAGCGDGVHIEAISEVGEKLAENQFFIGLDISMPALLAARERQQGRFGLTQSDVSQLPFRDGVLDIVFSFGVLAYTTDPFASFSELCRVIRPGGLVGIWVYPKSEGLGGRIFSLVRNTCKLIGPLGTRLIADSIVPFLGILPTRSRITLRNATWAQCREIVLVNIAPPQLFFPTLSEVEEWFSKNDINVIHQDDQNPITLWGEKC